MLTIWNSFYLVILYLKNSINEILTYCVLTHGPYSLVCCVLVLTFMFSNELRLWLQQRSEHRDLTAGQNYTKRLRHGFRHFYYCLLVWGGYGGHKTNRLLPLRIVQWADETRAFLTPPETFDSPTLQWRVFARWVNRLCSLNQLKIMVLLRVGGQISTFWPFV